MDILDKVTGCHTTVALMGDSWSCGEWYLLPDHKQIDIDPISHRSPEVFLHEQFDYLKIYHLGTQGGTNLTQAKALAKIFEYADLGIVYWTCPGRDIINDWVYDIENNNQETMEVVQNLSVDKFNKLCRSYSAKALEIFNSFNIPICFIGGQVSLPNMDTYNNCYPVIDRMVNLIDEPFWDWNTKTAIAGKCHNKIDWLGLERMMNVSDTFSLSHEQIEKFQQQFMDDGGHRGPWDSYYFPDQGHGGRHLHKIAINKLVDFIKDKDFI